MNISLATLLLISIPMPAVLVITLAEFIYQTIKDKHV